MNLQYQFPKLVADGYKERYFEEHKELPGEVLLNALEMMQEDSHELD